MNDTKRDKLLEQIRLFNKQMDWEQFNTASNLAKSISIGEGELLECFQWGDDQELNDVSDELVDVYSYVLMIADEIMMANQKKTKEKYPVKKFKWISTKYNKL